MRTAYQGPTHCVQSRTHLGLIQGGVVQGVLLLGGTFVVKDAEALCLDDDAISMPCFPWFSIVVSMLFASF